MKLFFILYGFLRVMETRVLGFASLWSIGWCILAFVSFARFQIGLTEDSIALAWIMAALGSLLADYLFRRFLPNNDGDEP